MGIIYRFLQRCPLAYLGSPVAATATQCALAAATINHREAFASVMKYFRDLLHLSQENVEVVIQVLHFNNEYYFVSESI